MAKVNGCWPASLDDCTGKLTLEHLVPLALWQAYDSSADRTARERTPIHVGGAEK
jgi:hypothetical protein